MRPRSFPDLARFLLRTGCRLGEAVGVHWEDVDFERQLVHLRRTVLRVPGQGVIAKRPKSKAGQRSLRIPLWLVAVPRDRRRGALPDPSGGTFDAAGDFDQLLDDDSYPTMRQVDPFGESTLGSAALPSLLADITAALQKARPGVETRGLLRLRRLAELCQGDRELRLVFVGD